MTGILVDDNLPDGLTPCNGLTPCDDLAPCDDLVPYDDLVPGCNVNTCTYMPSLDLIFGIKYSSSFRNSGFTFRLTPNPFVIN